MSNFLVLNLQDFGLNQDITETIRTYTPLCICCLDKNSNPLVNVLTCEHARFLRQFGKPEVDISNQLICIQCHAMLKKIEGFRKQVEESFRLLSEQAQDINGPYYNVRAVTLQRTQTETVDVLEREVEVKKEMQNVSEPIVTIHEGEDDSEEEPVKKKKRVKKGAKVPKYQPKEETKAKQPLYKRLSGKVRMVSLTQEEIEQERRRDAASEGYLKFPYRCEDCVLGFDHEPNYAGHMERKHQKVDGAASCPVCKTVLSSEKSMKKHVKNHYTRYDCVACGKRYINLYSIMQHYSTEHGGVGVTYKCRMCDYVTSTISAYAYHRNKHRKNLECSECGKLCSSSANLKTHLFAVHKKSDRTYECPTCKKSYNTKSGFEHHAATAHSAKPAPGAYCGLCNAQFNSVRCYKAHLRLNSKHLTQDSKKFSCPECDSKFVTLGSMKRHREWVHLKLCRHQCPLCGEGFRTRSMMQKHNKFVHEKILPPRNKICQYCGKGFKTNQVLRSHIRTHTGERPLQCPLCPASFAHNAALYTHKKLIHKTVPAKSRVSRVVT